MNPSIPPAGPSGFAPPSSPGFGTTGGPATAGYGQYPQPPVLPTGGYGQFGQNGQQAPQTQQYGPTGYAAPGYQSPGYPAPGYAAPGYPPAQPYPVAVMPTKPAKPAAKLANTGLILGAIGVIGGIFFGWTLLLSLAAIVLGFLARSREPHARGIALGAIVTGFVGVVLSLGWLTYSILTWLALTTS